MREAFDVSITDGMVDDDNPGIALKIQTPHAELNVWIRADDVQKLERVATASWYERGSIRIGESAGASAFWSADAESLSILIGQDDETWDVGVMVPIEMLSDISREVRSIGASPIGNGQEGVNPSSKPCLRPMEKTGFVAM